MVPVKLVGLEMQVTMQAIGAVPSLVVYPAIPFIAFGFFFFYWLSALLYLFNVGKIRQNNCKYNSRAYAEQFIVKACTRMGIVMSASLFCCFINGALKI
jgi:hypothetical protein